MPAFQPLPGTGLNIPSKIILVDWEPHWSPDDPRSTIYSLPNPSLKDFQTWVVSFFKMAEQDEELDAIHVRGRNEECPTRKIVNEKDWAKALEKRAYMKVVRRIVHVEAHSKPILTDRFGSVPTDNITPPRLLSVNSQLLSVSSQFYPSNMVHNEERMKAFIAPLSISWDNAIDKLLEGKGVAPQIDPKFGLLQRMSEELNPGGMVHENVLLEYMSVLRQ